MALALDGSGHANVTSGSTISASLTTAVANDVLIATVLVNGTADVSSVSGGGGTWNLIARSASATSHVEAWYSIASGTLSGTTIQVTLTTSTPFATLDVFGISGADTSTVFDANASTPATNTTNADLSVSTDTADTFILYAYRFVATASPDVGAGFTKISGANFLLSAYKIVSATQSGLALTVASGTRNGGVADAVIIAAGGGGSPTRGTPFGNRSTAFNGGRTFHGIIQ